LPGKEEKAWFDFAHQPKTDKEKTAGTAHPAKAVLTPPTTGEAIKVSIKQKTLLKMKKLSKLSINPSKVMKNEELVNLKGGYGGGYGGEGPCTLYCYDFNVNYLGSVGIPYCHYPQGDICKNYYPDSAITHCMC
jgi:hypothetical protein